MSPSASAIAPLLTVGGAVVGGIYGGPLGAAAGASAGGALASALTPKPNLPNAPAPPPTPPIAGQAKTPEGYSDNQQQKSASQNIYTSPVGLEDNKKRTKSLLGS